MSLKNIAIRNRTNLKWPKILIAILSTIGVVDTGSITLKGWGLFSSLSCPGINNGCEKVLNSPWGSLFELKQLTIPLSLAGLIIYLLLLILSLLLTLKFFSSRKKLNQFTWWLIFLISCASSSFSLILIFYIMLIKIKGYCFFCILSATLSISIFILSMIGAKFESREPMLYRGFIVALTVLIGGLIWSNNVDPSKAIDISSNSEKLSPAITTLSSPQKVKFAKFLSENNI